MIAAFASKKKKKSKHPDWQLTELVTNIQDAKDDKVVKYL